jgi:hypothetical protein
MQDAQLAAFTRRKLVALRIASGASVLDASKWADENLNDAIARVQAAPKGTDPFAVLKTTTGKASQTPGKAPNKAPDKPANKLRVR